MKKLAITLVMYFTCFSFLHAENACRRDLRADSLNISYTARLIDNLYYIEVGAPLYETLVDQNGIQRETKLVDQVQIVDRIRDPYNLFGGGSIPTSSLNALYKNGGVYTYNKHTDIRKEKMTMSNTNYLFPSFNYIGTDSMRIIFLQGKELLIKSSVVSSFKNYDNCNWIIIFICAIIYTIITICILISSYSSFGQVIEHIRELKWGIGIYCIVGMICIWSNFDLLNSNKYILLVMVKIFGSYLLMFLCINLFFFILFYYSNTFFKFFKSFFKAIAPC